MLKLLTVGTIAAAVTCSATIGCRRAWREGEPPHFLVTYYDRNRDGIVDLEAHQAPGWSHGHWWLVDPDFNACYDTLYVDGVQPVHVMVPVPDGVKITKTVPEHLKSFE